MHINSIDMLLKKPILSSCVEKPPIATVDIACDIASKADIPFM